MLTHGTPWQAALGHALMTIIFFTTLMAFSLINGYFNWPPILTILSLLVGFFIILPLIPLSFQGLSTFSAIFWNPRCPNIKLHT